MRRKKASLKRNNKYPLIINLSLTQYPSNFDVFNSQKN